VLHHYTHNSYDTDAAALFAVALPRGEVSGLAIGEEEWEDLCGESGGWEFIDGSVLGRKEGRNEYGGTFPGAKVWGVRGAVGSTSREMSPLNRQRT